MFMYNRHEGVLIIGGASRNVGKTTFSCQIIEHFSNKYAIIGLKVKTIYEGDDFFHGKDRSPLETDFRLIEEFDDKSDEDTGKMLRSGAKRVFRLKVKSHALKKAFLYFTDQINENSLIVCESNSIRKILQPDLFLLIKNQEENEMKPSAKELEKFADKIILTDGKHHDFTVSQLGISNGKWVIEE